MTEREAGMCHKGFSWCDGARCKYCLGHRAGAEAEREPLQKIAEMNCVDKWAGCDNEDHAMDCPVLAARMAIAAPIEGEKE